MTKTLIIVLATIVVGASAGTGIYLHSRGQKTATTLPEDSFVAQTRRGDITQTVQATGPVASNLDVQIKCRASGEVITLPFDISDHVKKGDLLVQLDQKDEKVLLDQAQVTLEQSESKLKEAVETEQMAELDLQTATEQADANIASAEVKATNLRRKSDRQKTLLTQTLASPEDFETAETDAAQAETDLHNFHIAKEELKSQAVALAVKKEDVELAKQQVQLDEISLQNAQQQMDYTTITAPMDGVIADLEIQKGTIISSATSVVGGGTSVITLSDMSHIFVLASVDESDIGSVEVGQRVNVTADAYPGRTFTGKVVRIALQGVNTSNVVTFEVKIEVTSDNRDLLKPQMTGNVEIVESSKSDVIMVPMMAIMRKQHNTYVTVLKPDNSTEERPITLGINDGENQEVTSGLSGGEQILVFRSDATNVWSAANIVKHMPAAGMPGRR